MANYALYIWSAFLLAAGILLCNLLYALFEARKMQKQKQL